MVCGRKAIPWQSSIVDGKSAVWLKNKIAVRMLREHGEKIIHVDNDLSTDFVQHLCDRFRPDFALLKEMPRTNATEAERQFKSRARRLVGEDRQAER